TVFQTIDWSFHRKLFHTSPNLSRPTFDLIFDGKQVTNVVLTNTSPNILYYAVYFLIVRITYLPQLGKTLNISTGL
ncbi:hypothetical protein L9F63_008791, partial [Diploptera punctata]